VIGEEGDVDLSKVDQSVLVEGFDQKTFDFFEGKVPETFQNAALKDLTVWVDPLDGTQVRSLYMTTTV
jgi:hypothetical protein